VDGRTASWSTTTGHWCFVITATTDDSADAVIFHTSEKMFICAEEPMLNSFPYVSHLESESGEPRDVVYETQSSNSMRVRGISEDDGEKSDEVHCRELVRHMDGMNRGAIHIDMTDYRCLVR
jgi:hypothetical protein